MADEATTPKRKRGRPRAFPETTKDLEALQLWEPNQSRRHQLNKVYEHLVIRALHRPGEHETDDEAAKDQENYRWLLPPWAEVMTQKGGRWKKTLIYELGKLIDADEIRKIALQLCKLKPKTVDGVAMVRRYRLGRPVVAEADREQLADVILKAVMAYDRTHRGTTNELAREALLDVVDMLEDPE